MDLQARIAAFPWWLFALIILIGVTLILISMNPDFAQAFNIIRTGIGVTIEVTIIAYSTAIILGLIAGLGRVSENVLTKNLATVYVELVRGIPLLVLIFFIALVIVPGATDLVSIIGKMLSDVGLISIGNRLSLVNNKSVPMNVRGIVALSLTYGAFLAEVFRAGIQSVSKGQMEASRSQGMSYGQAMRYVILPQAIRNVLPALGNDFISMLKDSSLVSILAVRDITQIARLYAGHSFHFPEAYMTLSITYLTMTLILSMMLKTLERRHTRNG
ncbi:MAG TPA: amino acid ABC transporter permease [Anaerolineae bacterium]|nr:amino acid ABC transporter permease [Anaerolineae bacterium]